MLNKKFSKKVVSIAAAAAMTVTGIGTTASQMGLITANAAAVNELFGEGTYETGRGLPWHICENATAKMNFAVSNGMYVVYIDKCGGEAQGGESAWDCQFRHRNLTLVQGKKYRLTYSVWASKDGRMYPKLGDATNDDKEIWHMNGTKLNLDYEPGLTQEQLESKLASASTTGETIEYGMGWDQWKNTTIKGGQWNTFSYEFTAQETAEGTGEMTFHLGGEGQWRDGGCFTDDTILKFDNLSLINLTDNTGVFDNSEMMKTIYYEPTGIEVNQVGYFPNLNKKATIMVDQGTAAQPFQIVNSAGTVVYQGTTGPTVEDTLKKEDWGYSQVIDFSDFKEVGTGYKIKCGGKTSLEFSIGSNIYDGMLTNALNYFYLNRSGIALDASYITSKGNNASKSDLVHGVGHPNDVAYIQSVWKNIYNTEGTDVETSNGTVDGTGGWYDAGDFGKYVVNGGISVWTLNNLFESSLQANDYNDSGDFKYGASNTTTMKTPESGDSVPDILQETKWETDWMFNMIRSDGMVYHKLHDHRWTGLAVRPDSTAEADQRVRIVKPVTYAATLNVAASFAQSARLWEKYDSTYASKLLTQAKACYDAAKKAYGDITVVHDKSDVMYAPIEDGKGGGAYGDYEVRDDFYWAACELYATTGEAAYKTDLETLSDYSYKVATELYGGENAGTFSSWTWGTTASCGTISLATAEKVDESIKQKCQSAVEEAAQAYVDETNDNQYGSSYHGMTYGITRKVYDSTSDAFHDIEQELPFGYEWGSNSMVANNAIVMALAYNYTENTDYLNGVVSSMDYLLGRNPLEQAYVTGYGTHHTNWPHHRFWSHGLNSELPYCPDGVLAGGPNSQMQDPMIGGAGYVVGETAPMLCYYDQLEAWSVNECTINWNSPLAYVVSFLEDNAAVESSNLDVSVDNSTIKVGETAQATAKSNGAAVNVSWSTSDASVASIDSTGKITGIKAGTVTITAKTSDGTTGTAKVTVTAAGAVTTTTSNDPDPDTSNLDVTLWGDADCNGEISVADIILTNKSITGTAVLTPQGKLNADCYQGDKEGVTGMDASAILMLNVNRFTQADMPLKSF